MKIKIKKEGGIMGLASQAQFNLNDLTPDERSALEAIINPNETMPEAYQTREMPSPDSIAYEIKFRKGAKTTILKFDDSTLPEKVYLVLQRYFTI